MINTILRNCLENIQIIKFNFVWSKALTESVIISNLIIKYVVNVKSTFTEEGKAYNK